MNTYILKCLLVIALLFFLDHPAKSQCNCEKINRNDGTQITQCQPLPIAYDENIQLGISAASNGQDNFISLVVKFSSSAKKLNDNLSIRLADNNMLTLDLVNSQLALIGNSETSQGIYNLTNSDVTKLQQSEIKTISFKLEDGLVRTNQVKENRDILMKQLKCL